MQDKIKDFEKPKEGKPEIARDILAWLREKLEKKKNEK